jgi:hypothetical protein
MGAILVSECPHLNACSTNKQDAHTDGGLVDVYRDNISEAYSQAVGSPPLAPPLLAPGGLVASFGKITVNTGIGTTRDIEVPIGWTYDPGPAAFDAQVVAEYQAALKGWSDHAANVKTIMDIIIAQLKTGNPPPKPS